MSLTHKIFVGLIFVLVLPFVTHVQAGADEKEAREETHVDLRPEKDRSAPPEYFVVFNARPSSDYVTVPGHAFIALGFPKDATCHYEGWGWYPKSMEPGKCEPREGSLTQEECTGLMASTKIFVSVAVSKEQFDKAVEVQKRWDGGTRDYKLWKKDCITFTDEVAIAVGLKRPDRGTFTLPDRYVQELAKLNQPKK